LDNLLFPALLGLLQGLTEFLPVSSSGHLAVLLHLSGWEESLILPLIVWLHLATILAVMLYFRKEMASMTRGLTEWGPARDRSGQRLLLLVAAGTVATAALVLPLRSHLLGLFSSPRVVPAGLGLTGLVLLLSDRIKGTKSESRELNLWRAVLIGLVQGLAVVPGLSRSGSTIAAGLFLGIGREEAFTFSFLLAVPATLGALVVTGDPLGAFTSGDIMVVLTGMAVAFASGYGALALLSRWVRRRRLYIFTIYCWCLAALLSYYII